MKARSRVRFIAGEPVVVGCIGHRSGGITLPASLVVLVMGADVCLLSLVTVCWASVATTGNLLVQLTAQEHKFLTVSLLSWYVCLSVSLSLCPPVSLSQVSVSRYGQVASAHACLAS